MLLGRSVVSWLVALFVAICFFLVAKWLIPLAFGLVSFSIPDNIVIILSLLIALGVFWYGPRVTGPVVAP